jgi:hypothetical protein
MATYLLPEHHRGAPAPMNDVTMARRTPQEVTDHIRFMDDFVAGPPLLRRLELAVDHRLLPRHRCREDTT